MKIGWVWRLYVYGTVSTLIGPFYDNWGSMEKYLYRVGAYSNLCPDLDPNAPATDTWSCKAQQDNVTMLLTIVRAAECTFSLFIGIFMDRVGPKITSLVGVALRTIGWTMIGYLPHFNFMLIVAFAFIGFSVNFIVFPALTIGLYTTAYRFIAIVQVGMCSCFASFIIRFKVLLLERGTVTPEQMNYLYSTTCLLPCLVICTIFFPLNLEHDLRANGIDLKDGARTSQCSATTNLSVPDNAVGELPLHAEVEVTAPTRQSETMKDPTVVDIQCELDHVICRKTSLRCYCDGLLRTLSTKEVIICLIYFAYNFGSITFVQQSYSAMYRDDEFLLTLSEYLIPLAFVPCLVFSALYLCVKPIWILLAVNVMGAFMHIIALVRGRIIGATLLLTLVIVYSILNTKVYNYLDTLFDENHIGSIVGVLNSTCGVWLLLQGFVLKGLSSPRELDVINYIMLALRIAFIIPFVYLAYAANTHKLITDGVDLESDDISQGKEDKSAAALVA